MLSYQLLMPAGAGARRYENWVHWLMEGSGVVCATHPIPSWGQAPALHFSFDPGLWLFGRRWLAASIYFRTTVLGAWRSMGGRASAHEIGRPDLTLQCAGGQAGDKLSLRQKKEYCDRQRNDHEQGEAVASVHHRRDR